MIYGDDAILNAWKRLKDLICAAELDAHKNSRGVYQAGIRFRKSLREIKRVAHDLLMMTHEYEKFYKSTRSKKIDPDT